MFGYQLGAPKLDLGVVKRQPKPAICLVVRKKKGFRRREQRGEAPRVCKSKTPIWEISKKKNNKNFGGFLTIF